MAVFYHVALLAYGFAIYLAAPFNRKAARWVAGRRGLFRKIRRTVRQVPGKRAWFHCASLGEFELAKPLITSFRKRYPDYRVVLTFFSPSGFENARHESYADEVFYLPLDGPLHARRFIRYVSPSVAFIVKNDLWFFYIREMARRRIPVFTVSVRFHKNQFYFRWFGRPFRRVLKRVDTHFVVDQHSLSTMYDAGLANVMVCGDLRFDRVADAMQKAPEDEKVAAFCKGFHTLIAGSTWAPDEKLLAGFCKDLPDYWRIVIAPHEVTPARLQAVERAFPGKTIRYAELDGPLPPGKQVLIIDRIGKLASLYRYGKYAYVGGAFGQGLHNILEAVAFGLPVFFGPRIRHFPEAVELTSLELAFVVRKPSELSAVINDLESGRRNYAETRSRLLAFVESRQGATRVILNHLEVNLVVS